MPGIKAPFRSATSFSSSWFCKLCVEGCLFFVLEIPWVGCLPELKTILQNSYAGQESALWHLHLCSRMQSTMASQRHACGSGSDDLLDVAGAREAMVDDLAAASDDACRVNQTDAHCRRSADGLCNKWICFEASREQVSAFHRASAHTSSIGNLIRCACSLWQQHIL